MNFPEAELLVAFGQEGLSFQTATTEILIKCVVEAVLGAFNATPRLPRGGPSESRVSTESIGAKRRRDLEEMPDDNNGGLWHRQLPRALAVVTGACLPNDILWVTRLNKLDLMRCYFSNIMLGMNLAATIWHCYEDASNALEKSSKAQKEAPVITEGHDRRMAYLEAAAEVLNARIAEDNEQTNLLKAISEAANKAL
ncbi:hypothetical protein NE237_014383 [Protea cynaroides]|uniref:Uncharacterized protein n=1 Tax=Protea cynaroides TaxID=273540 RepID=A0A9Q0KC01_9MAGN|nr:hypothetical protein NE237_014383 [Protea cynaroides]